MEKNLYIDASHPNETRVVLKSDENIEDYEYEGLKNNLIKNNIYLGKVVRIVPGMQAAFVDVGLDRPGFLHLSDIHTSLIINADDDSAAQTNIRNFLHDGQSILVQVSKDPLAKKGARLTTRITLPAKFLVLTAKEKEVGISQKIENEEKEDEEEDNEGEYEDGEDHNANDEDEDDNDEYYDTRQGERGSVR